MPTPCLNRTLFIHRSILSDDPRFSTCRVITMTPLLRELIVAVDDWKLDLEKPEDRRIGLVLVDCLKRSPQVPVNLCMPQNRKLQELCAAVLGAPEKPVILENWSVAMNMSLRSLSRLFIRQTGFTIGHWILLARMNHARVLLEQGESVTEASMACGYSSVSSFITVFRKEFGVTPGVYQKERRGIKLCSSFSSREGDSACGSSF